MAHTDPLNRRVVEQMLVGVSTRQYARSLEPIGEGKTSRGTNKSAVSRRFVAQTAAQLETPSWAVAYFQWKSGQASPDDPSWKIDVTSEKKIQSATAIPMGGDLARGGSVDPTGGISVESATAAIAQSGNVSVYSMTLTGEIVGYWENHPIVPGLTFGWAPRGVGLIAFADTSGKLALMDRSGKARRIDTTKAVTLPAWSVDGTRLAYLEKTGRTTYALIVATVAR